jgi:hypothetical protein
MLSFVQMMRFFHCTLIILVYTSGLFGQMEGAIHKYQDPLNLPRVFMIGEYEKPYEKMSSVYSRLLLNVYHDDIDKAFSAWTSVLISMEDYAREVSFNLNGLKLWMNVFFNVDGSIQHIVYYPKPNSRNMQFDQLTNFLISFCNVYQFKDPIPNRCSHFGSASFPTFAKRN